MREIRNFSGVLQVLLLLCYSELLNTVNGINTTELSLNSTEESSPLIAKLRSRIENLDINSYFTSDKQLAQYIEGSAYNFEQAAIWLRQTAHWRNSSGVNHILNWTPSSFLRENFPYELTGYTDEGNPVFYLPVGKWNYRAVQKAGLGSEIYKYYSRLVEYMRKSAEGQVNPKTGELSDQIVVIEDLDGYSFLNLLTIRNNLLITVARLLRNVDRYYPFVAKKYMVVRAPVVLPVFLPVARRIFPRLQKILRMYNRFSIKGADELRHTVPSRSLPVELGGTYITQQFRSKFLST